MTTECFNSRQKSTTFVSRGHFNESFIYPVTENLSCLIIMLTKVFYFCKQFSHAFVLKRKPDFTVETSRMFTLFNINSLYISVEKLYF